MRRARELWWALGLSAVAIALWIAAVPSAQRAPGAAIGHALGIAGLALMLATEILYSIRKRSHGRAWGPMQAWLRAHVITGIVGPVLVGLHTAGHLHGVAGWAAIATAIVVASGFTGRYLYTAIPRAADGAELSTRELDAQMSNAELRLSAADLGGRARRRAERDAARLRRRASGAAAMRRLLSAWHTVHVPFTLAMFTLAVIHVVVAIYYGAGMR
jgi:hypothetical protein